MPPPKPQNRTRWNAIVQDWSFVADYSDTLMRCYRLSERAAVALLGICEYLAWENRWTNADAMAAALRELRSAAERGLSDPLSCDTEDCTFYDCLWPIFEYQYHWPLDNALIKSWSYDADNATVFALSNIGRAAPEIYFTLPHGVSCTIHLQTVLLGGKVQVFDGGIFPIATVDTYADVTTIPPETTTEIIVPISAYAEDTLITIRFTASFDLEEIPLTFGGGFLGVTFCGDISIMPFQLRQNEDNPCLLEQTLNSGQSWLTAFDYSLCSSAVSQVVIRFNAELNIYEISNDGGTTWVDGTGTVPQDTSPTFPMPELADGHEAKCQAVNNVISEFKANVEAIEAQFTIGGGIGAFSGIFGSLLAWALTGFFGIAAIIAAAAAALVSAGGVAFGLAFTEEDIWQPLTELLYCNVGDDMAFSPSQWQAVGIGVNAQFTGIAKKHLSNLLLMLGNVGLTNIARTDHGVYDDTFCSCNTWCRAFDFTQSNGGFEQWLGEGASYATGIGWQDITRQNGGKGLEIIRYFDASAITDIEVTVVSDNITNGNVYIGTDPGGWYVIDTQSNGTHTYVHNGLTLTGITSVLINASAQYATQITVTSVTLRGTGENPFGENNC